MGRQQQQQRQTDGVEVGENPHAHVDLYANYSFQEELNEPNNAIHRIIAAEMLHNRNNNTNNNDNSREGDGETNSNTIHNEENNTNHIEEGYQSSEYNHDNNNNNNDSWYSEYGPPHKKKRIKVTAWNGGCAKCGGTDHCNSTRRKCPMHTSYEGPDKGLWRGGGGGDNNSDNNNNQSASDGRIAIGADAAESIAGATCIHNSTYNNNTVPQQHATTNNIILLYATAPTAWNTTKPAITTTGSDAGLATEPVAANIASITRNTTSTATSSNDATSSNANAPFFWGETVVPPSSSASMQIGSSSALSNATVGVGGLLSLTPATFTWGEKIDTTKTTTSAAVNERMAQSDTHAMPNGNSSTPYWLMNHPHTSSNLLLSNNNNNSTKLLTSPFIQEPLVLPPKSSVSARTGQCAKCGATDHLYSTKYKCRMHQDYVGGSSSSVNNNSSIMSVVENRSSVIVSAIHDHSRTVPHGAASTNSRTTFDVAMVGAVEEC